jgi:hypothetical protein
VSGGGANDAFFVDNGPARRDIVSRSEAPEGRLTFPVEDLIL